MSEKCFSLTCHLRLCYVCKEWGCKTGCKMGCKTRQTGIFAVFYQRHENTSTKKPINHQTDKQTEEGQPPGPTHQGRQTTINCNFPNP